MNSAHLLVAVKDQFICDVFKQCLEDYGQSIDIVEKMFKRLENLQTTLRIAHASKREYLLAEVKVISVLAPGLIEIRDTLKARVIALIPGLSRVDFGLVADVIRISQIEI